MGIALLILVIAALAVPAALGGNRPATALLWIGGSLLWLMGAVVASVIAGTMLGMAGVADDYLVPAGLACGGSLMFWATYKGLRAT
ncbi:hypothetical protein D9M68_483820 [compost metagenome]